jgi:hypothetical protein
VNLKKENGAGMIRYCVLHDFRNKGEAVIQEGTPHNAHGCIIL